MLADTKLLIDLDNEDFCLISSCTMSQRLKPVVRVSISLFIRENKITRILLGNNDVVVASGVGFCDLFSSEFDLVWIDRGEV